MWGGDSRLLIADSIKKVAKELAADLMTMYNGDQPGQIPGLLPQPYYCE